jgi:integrase
MTSSTSWRSSRNGGWPRRSTWPCIVPLPVVFKIAKGGQLRRSNFHRTWDKARTLVGLPGLHSHDLRRTGGALSAATGATLKELMARLGHSSVRAAMIYQHATRDREG